MNAAGQAAAAYDQSTADTRRQVYRQREVQQRLQQQEELAALGRAQQQAQQAALQDHRDRTHRLNERSLQIREGQAMMKGVVPMSGDGLGMAFQQLSATDPTVAQQFMQEMQARYPELKADSPPEEYEAHPAFRTIHAETTELLSATRAAKREQAMQSQVQNSERAINSLLENRQLWSDDEAQLQRLELESRLAEVAADPDAGPGDVRAITKAFRNELAAESSVRRERMYATVAADKLFDEFPRTSIDTFDDPSAMNRWVKANELYGDIPDSDDPQGVLSDIFALVHPVGATAARRAYERGLRERNTGEAVADAQRQQMTPEAAAEMGQDLFNSISPWKMDHPQAGAPPATPRADTVAREVPDAPAPTPDAVPVDTPVGKALRPPVPEGEAQFLAFLDRKGVALDDEEAITKAAEDWQALPARKASAQERREMAVLNRRIYGTDDTRAIVKRRAEAFKKHWERRGLESATEEEKQEFVSWFTSSIARQYEAEQAKIDGGRNATAPDWVDAIYAAPGAVAGAVRDFGSWIKGGDIDMSNVPAELLVGLE